MLMSYYFKYHSRLSSYVRKNKLSELCMNMSTISFKFCYVNQPHDWISLGLTLLPQNLSMHEHTFMYLSTFVHMQDV